MTSLVSDTQPGTFLVLLKTNHMARKDEIVQASLSGVTDQGFS